MTATSWLLLLINAVLIVLAYMARRSPRWKKHWSPFHSKEGQEICSHLTEEEELALRRFAARFGFLPALIFLFPLAGALGLPSLWIAVVLIVAYVILVPKWLRSLKEFLCSTQWASDHGYDPRTLKLFSFIQKT